jgi:hypothetical protein
MCEEVRLDDVRELERLEGVEAGVQSVVEAEHATAAAIDELAEQLDQVEGSPVRIVGSEAVVETRDSAPTEGATEANFEGLEAAVVADTETNNSNLWGLAGLFVGFGTLMVLYRVVRP